MAEREKRIELESQVDGYKQELKDSYRVIVEMRYVSTTNSDHFFALVDDVSPFLLIDLENFCRLMNKQRRPKFECI